MAASPCVIQLSACTPHFNILSSNLVLPLNTSYLLSSSWLSLLYSLSPCQAFSITPHSITGLISCTHGRHVVFDLTALSELNARCSLYLQLSVIYTVVLSSLNCLLPFCSHSLIPSDKKYIDLYHFARAWHLVKSPRSHLLLELVCFLSIASNIMLSN